MANSMDTNWNSRGNGPSCPKCHNNEQVMKSTVNYTKRLVGLKIPLGKATITAWFCHNHNTAEPISE